MVVESSCSHHNPSQSTPLSACRNSIGRRPPASLEERISCTLIIKWQIYIWSLNNYGWKWDQIKIKSERTKLSLERKSSEIRVYSRDICNYACRIAHWRCLCIFLNVNCRIQDYSISQETRFNEHFYTYYIYCMYTYKRPWLFSYLFLSFYICSP